jgi:transposase InsO family protein
MIAAADFFTIEIWTLLGLTRYLVFFVIELATRRVEIAGLYRNPNGTWMEQVGRNLVDEQRGFVNKKKYLIHDRDPLYTLSFQRTLAGAGVKSLKLPPRSPNLNAYAERFVRSIKQECLGRMILFGERGLKTALREYTEHYHQERNHQGIENQLIVPATAVVGSASIERKKRLGGLLSHYYRAA